MKPRLVLALCLSAFPLFSFSAFAQITLAWDAPVCTNIIASYNLYTGPASRAYTNASAVGANLTATIPIPPLTPIYIAATAVDVAGLESDFSNEVSYTNPGPALTNLAVTITTTGTQILFARALAGPWTPTNAACITLINPIPPLYFRSRGPTTNQVAITRLPF